MFVFEGSASVITCSAVCASPFDGTLALKVSGIATALTSVEAWVRVTCRGCYNGWNGKGLGKILGDDSWNLL